LLEIASPSHCGVLPLEQQSSIGTLQRRIRFAPILFSSDMGTSSTPVAIISPPNLFQLSLRLAAVAIQRQHTWTVTVAMSDTFTHWLSGNDCWKPTICGTQR